MIKNKISVTVKNTVSKYLLLPGVQDRYRLVNIGVMLVVGVMLAACRGRTAPAGETPGLPGVVGSPSAAAMTAEASVTAGVTPTAAAPLAARVNGKGILLAEYQAEVAQFEAASGREATAEEKQGVLQSMVDQELLAQGAAEQGFEVTAELLQGRIEQVNAQLTGGQTLEGWMTANGYTNELFRAALVRAAAAAWMRDQIAAGTPRSAEQVHARQVLFSSAAAAEQALGQLQAGGDFENLALEFDPLTAGDLGWFPRGVLLDVQVEEAAFGLQPGEFSGVIQTAAGYHIIQVIERSAQRVLAPEALLSLQLQAVRGWLVVRRSQSQIEVLV